MSEAITTQTNTSLDVLRFYDDDTGFLAETLHIGPDWVTANSWVSEKYDVFGEPSIAITVTCLALSIATTFGASVEESLDGEHWCVIPADQFTPTLTDADIQHDGDVLSLKMYLRTHYVRVRLTSYLTLAGADDIELMVQINAGEA
jgi:hypothetical protein